jgi:hypothetical protein
MIEEAAASKQAKRLLLPCATGLVELAREPRTRQRAAAAAAAAMARCEQAAAVGR